jgi:hypothetical protein
MSSEAVAGQLQRMVQGVEAYRWLHGYAMDDDILTVQCFPSAGDKEQVRRPQAAGT